MKKVLFTLLMTFMSLITITSVEAKTSISIGTDYGNVDSSGEATTAYNKTKGMGYTAYLSTKPTVSTVSSYANTFKNGGTNGIMFFHGHGSSSRIIWNYLGNGGSYAAGITKYGSMCSFDGYDLLSISEFKPSNAKLAVFMGCETTSNSTDNIASTAVSQGAKAAFGFDKEIYDGDTDKWTNRFFTKLASGATVNASITYANGFSDYSYPSNMKSARKYGTTSVTLKSEEIAEYNMNSSKLEEQKIKTYSRNYRKNISKDEVVEYIKDSYNSSFDLNNYIYSYNDNGEEQIYTFNLIVNGVQSNIGYTVIVDNNNINVIDNMKIYNEKSAMYYKPLNIENFDEEAAIKEALEKHPSIHENIEVTFHSTFKHFDVETGKMYFDVNLKVYDKVLDVKSIVTEKFEM